MITLLILIPVLGSLLLIPISGGRGESNNNQMRRIALTTSLINLFVSLFKYLRVRSGDDVAGEVVACPLFVVASEWGC